MTLLITDGLPYEDPTDAAEDLRNDNIMVRNIEIIFHINKQGNMEMGIRRVISSRVRWCGLFGLF